MSLCTNRSVFSPKYKDQYHDLESVIVNNRIAVEKWFRDRWLDHEPPFYGSVDLRNTGYKLAPVDMNLFPGGFNNLDPDQIPLAAFAVEDAVERRAPGAKSILVVPESHTRNLFYLQNIATFKNILEQSGYVVRFGTVNPEIEDKAELETALGDTVLLERLRRQGDALALADGFEPDMVLLNNDLSGGVPDILVGAKQLVTPPLSAGWHFRRKSGHFKRYDEVAGKFAETIGIDPWRLNAYHENLGGLDFRQSEGVERLADSISQLMEKTRVKYKEYGVDDKPYVIVKADAGTYGMGVMSVKDPNEVLKLNRKARNKMSTVKEGMQVTEVIIQEGVYTAETVCGAVAEPVVYMIDRYVLGGFFRVHEGRKADENLNASGMAFVPLTGAIPMPEFEEMERFDKNRHYEIWEAVSIPDCHQVDCPSNRFYLYGVAGRLSALAASMEIEDLKSACAKHLAEKERQDPAAH